MQELLLKIRYFERGLSKSLHGQSYKKQKGSGTSNQSLFRLQNKFRKIPLFVMHYVTKSGDVM